MVRALERRPRPSWSSPTTGHSSSPPSSGREQVSLATWEAFISEESTCSAGMLRRGETINLSRLPEDLPEEAREERISLASPGFDPPHDSPEVSGRPIAPWPSALLARAHWPAELIQRLRLLGEVFANALARRNQALCLERALAEVRELKAQLENENLYLRKEIDAAVRAGGGSGRERGHHAGVGAGRPGGPDRRRGAPARRDGDGQGAARADLHALGARGTRPS